jgi:hypothetical protein
MRCENWPSVLNDHLTNVPTFQWGQNDCALWCGDWLAKATGIDFTPEWRGKYATKQEALTFMIGKGFAHYCDIINSYLLPKQIAFAQRGDIMLHPTGNALGICNGYYSHFLTENGTIRTETLTCSRAWRVQ